MAKTDLLCARRTLWAFAAAAGFCTWVTLAAGCGGSGVVLATSADRRVSLLNTTAPISGRYAPGPDGYCEADRFSLFARPGTSNQAVVDLIARNTSSRNVGVYPTSSNGAGQFYDVVVSGPPDVSALVQAVRHEPAVISARQRCGIVVDTL